VIFPSNDGRLYDFAQSQAAAGGKFDFMGFIALLEELVRRNDPTTRLSLDVYFCWLYAAAFLGVDDSEFQKIAGLGLERSTQSAASWNWSGHFQSGAWSKAWSELVALCPENTADQWTLFAFELEVDFADENKKASLLIPPRNSQLIDFLGRYGEAFRDPYRSLFTSSIESYESALEMISAISRGELRVATVDLFDVSLATELLACCDRCRAKWNAELSEGLLENYDEALKSGGAILLAQMVELYRPIFFMVCRLEDAAPAFKRLGIPKRLDQTVDAMQLPVLASMLQGFTENALSRRKSSLQQLGNEAEIQVMLQEDPEISKFDAISFAYVYMQLFCDGIFCNHPRRRAVAYSQLMELEEVKKMIEHIQLEGDFKAKADEFRCVRRKIEMVGCMGENLTIPDWLSLNDTLELSEEDFTMAQVHGVSMGKISKFDKKKNRRARKGQARRKEKEGKRELGFGSSTKRKG
jgi:hypothetical protein